MEKRVVIFLVLSLAVILGYDLLLKQLGLLPPPETVQEPPAETTTTSAGGSDVSPAARDRRPSRLLGTAKGGVPPAFLFGSRTTSRANRHG